MTSLKFVFQIFAITKSQPNNEVHFIPQNLYVSSQVCNYISIFFVSIVYLSTHIRISKYFDSTEYAIAFLGSIEGGLIITTINDCFKREEISQQLISCRPKAIFCLVDKYDVMKNACVQAQHPNTTAIKTDPTVHFKMLLILRNS